MAKTFIAKTKVPAIKSSGKMHTSKDVKLGTTVHKPGHGNVAHACKTC
jgi:hypothetical protein